MHDPEQIPQRVHVVGAGGFGMSGLAKILSQLGHTVSGSDLKPGRMLDVLIDVGVETWIGHRPEMASAAELLVCSSAVPQDDPELVAARGAGIPVWRRPTLLAALTGVNRTLGLAGTHGKTTSSALAVTALRGSGHDPSFMVGGEIVGMNTGAHVGDSAGAFVLEADEAFGTFRHLDLQAVLVSNIEADHLDHYGSLSALEDAFAQVVDAVDGPRVGCIDDPGVRRLAQRTSLTTYGFDRDADWVLGDVSHEDGGVSFSVTGPLGVTSVALRQPGIHLALNATGVLAMLSLAGFDIDAAAEALSRFSGVRRRYEIRAVVGGVTIVDDYAHHPTEVAATIAAAQLGAKGSVIAVFQPHRYSRTADLGPDFGEPLALADTVLVTDVYSAGERPIIGVSGKLVAQSAEAAGVEARFVQRLDELPALVADIATPGDIVLLMGAGDITAIAPGVAHEIEISS